jgi:hypothetical protein
LHEHARAPRGIIPEQTAEVDACLAALGARPVQWLLERFDVDARWCLVHATHGDERETLALANSGAIAGLCLTTEANFGDGLFHAGDYLDAGGAFGVGSDSHIGGTGARNCACSNMASGSRGASATCWRRHRCFMLPTGWFRCACGWSTGERARGWCA